jgi:hypothetical protein
MKHEGDKAARNQKPFWKRIIERHRQRRSLLRAPVPLVFFRSWPVTHFSRSHNVTRSVVQSYPLHLQIQLCWPSFAKTRSSHVTLQQFNTRHDRTSSILNSSQAIVHKHEHQREQTRTGEAQQLSVTHVASPPLEHKNERESPVERTANDRASGTTHSEAKVYASSAQNTIHLARQTFANTVVMNNTLTRAAQQKSFTSPLRKFVDGPPKTIQHEIFLRHALSSELLRNVKVMTATPPSLKSQRTFLAPTNGEGAASLVDRARSTANDFVPRSFPVRAPREFLMTPAAAAAEREDKTQSSQSQTKSEAQRVAVTPTQPVIDVGRLSEEVYRHIQRKIRVERERRGL